MRQLIAVVVGVALCSRAGVSEGDAAPPSVADLRVSTSDGVTSVAVGARILDEIVVANDGPDRADGTVVTAPAVADLERSAVTCRAAGGAVCPRDLAVRALERHGLFIERLPSGGRLTLTVAATVTSADRAIQSTAIVRPPRGISDPDPDNNVAIDSDAPASDAGDGAAEAPAAASAGPAAPVADLSVTISDGEEFVMPGGATAYTVQVLNIGPGAADGAVLASPSVPGLARGTIGCVSSEGAQCPPRIDLAGLEGEGIKIPHLPAGGGVTLTIPAEVWSATEAVNSVVRVTAPAGTIDPWPDDNQATDHTEPIKTIDLRVQTTDAVETLRPGADTTYAVVVTNDGAVAADGAVVSLPSTSQLTRKGIRCAVVAGDAQCPDVLALRLAEGAGLLIPKLPPGAALRLAVDATVNASDGKVRAEAIVTGPRGTRDATPHDNHAADTDLVTAVADLRVTSSDGAEAVRTGRTTVYKVEVTNRGPDPADGAVLRAPEAAGLDLLSVTCRASRKASCPDAVTTSELERGGLVIPTLPADGSVTFQISARVTAKRGSVTSLATATLPPGIQDPTPGNASAEDEDTASGSADLRVTQFKRVTGAHGHRQLSYVIEVANAGPVDADGALVVAPPAADLRRTKITCIDSDGAVCPLDLDAGLLESGGLKIPSLPADGRIQLTVVTEVTATEGQVVSSASVILPADTVDPMPGNNIARSVDLAESLLD